MATGNYKEQSSASEVARASREFRDQEVMRDTLDVARAVLGQERVRVVSVTVAPEWSGGGLVEVGMCEPPPSLTDASDLVVRLGGVVTGAARPAASLSRVSVHGIVYTESGTARVIVECSGEGS